MSDAAATPARKKRSFFKRAAWQDAPKDEGKDMFSHSNEFKNIVAEQNRQREDEKRREEEAARSRKMSEPRESKRRRVSNDEQPVRAGRLSSKTRSRTPLSPASSQPPPDSLAARYDSLTKSASSSGSLSHRESNVIDLGDDQDEHVDEVDEHLSSDRTTVDQPTQAHPAWDTEDKHSIPVRSSRPRPIEIEDDDDDEPEEAIDPALAALRQRARAKAAQQRSTALSPDGNPIKAPVIQLFIEPHIPDAAPLMVKIRIDSTLERTRQAWCGKQHFSPHMTQNVFFTWKNMRMYDSTTVKRMGIQVDQKGNLTVEGDHNIYDEVNIPKIVVEAWTEELFLQHQKETTAQAAAKKTAAEVPPVLEDRTPTPEPKPVANKILLKLQAKGKDEFGIYVNPDSTFAHIASAYKSRFKIEKSQPVTLLFDGERLSPLDTVESVELENEDAVEVLFK